MNRSRRLIVLTFALLFVGLAALEARLFFLQVLHSDALARQLTPYHVRQLELPAPRGRVLDRNDLPLAVSVPAWDVEVYLPVVRDPERLVQRLDECLPVKADELGPCPPSHGMPKVKILVRGLQDDPVVWCLQDQIERRRLPGVTMRRRFVRRYPQHDLGGMVVGFVNYAGKGVAGLEASFDSLLAGHGGWRTQSHDAKNIELAGVDSEHRSPQPGSDLVTTIDLRFQQVAREALVQLCETYEADRAVAVVTDPGSGEILALMQHPTIDPENLEASRPKDWRNLAIEDYYAPGSVFKAFSMAMALEKGAVRLTESIDCENGAYRIRGRTIRDVHGMGRVSLEDVIVHSSNVGISKVLMRLVPEGTPKGSELFRYPYETLLNLGYGRPTGLGLPHETPGKVTRLSEWTRNYTLASISFGYEVGVTAIQLAQAFGVYANSGVLAPLRLIHEIRRADGSVESPEMPSRRRVFSPETTAKVVHMLQRVVEDGTGKKCRIEGIPVAGKTGSSVPAGSAGKRCTKTAAFIAFAPVDAPRLLVLVVAQKDNVSGKFRGGTVAAPAVRMILEKGLALLGVRKSNRIEGVMAGGSHAGY